MSDMQLYLIALGAIIIAVVILYNWWQERRLRQEAMQRFATPEDDALMEGELGEEAPWEEGARLITPADKGRSEEFDIRSSIRDDDNEPGFAEPTINLSIDDIPEDTPLANLPGMSANDLPADSEQLSTAPLLTDDEFVDDGIAQADLVLHDDAAESQAPSLPSGMDAAIDLIGLIYLPEPVMGETVRAALQPMPGFEKYTQWLGMDDAGTWHPLDKESSRIPFTHIACALQYADRAGAVSRECLRKFQHKIEDLAQKLNGGLEWSQGEDALKYAEALDQFCIEVDVMLGFHVMQGSSGLFAATKLRGIAEANGLQLKEDGAFHRLNDRGETLFRIISQDQRPLTAELLRTAFLRGVSFQLDVPRVQNCTEVFNQMVVLAQQMASALDGVLVDDRQQPLGDLSIHALQDQLRVICAKLAARNLAPGSTTARRLFS